MQLGFIVDSVEEVTAVTSDQIEAPPEFGVGFDATYLLGIAKVKQRVHLLLDIRRVATGEAVAISTSALPAPVG